MFARLLPLAGMMLFVALGFGLRAWLQYRRYGNWGIALFRSSDLRHQIRDGIFCMLFGAILLQALVFAFDPALLSPVMIVSPAAWLIWSGALLLVGGLLLTVAAQLRMGASWRIGIDHAASPGLVTGGLYRFSRNPIYVGMLSTMVGLSILLPTWFSLALLAGVVWCVRTQVLEEEAYLYATYGREFEAYTARVGRFVPWLGKVPAREIEPSSIVSTSR